MTETTNPETTNADEAAEKAERDKRLRALRTGPGAHAMYERAWDLVVAAASRKAIVTPGQIVHFLDVAEFYAEKVHERTSGQFSDDDDEPLRTCVASAPCPTCSAPVPEGAPHAPHCSEICARWTHVQEDLVAAAGELAELAAGDDAGGDASSRAVSQGSKPPVNEESRAFERIARPSDLPPPPTPPELERT